MTNYTSYPKWRLCKNSCVISFADGGYSWCMLSKNQRLYLLNSEYLKKAKVIDVMFYSGKLFSFTKEQFKEWLQNNIQPKENVIDNDSAMEG